MLVSEPPTVSCSVGDCDPLQRYGVSTSFGFLRILLDAEEQDLQAVDAILDMWDAVEDGERLARVFTEQKLQAQSTNHRSATSATIDSVQSVSSGSCRG